MSKKLKTQYRCKECSTVSPRWSGRCHQCGAWDTLIEEVERDETTPHRAKPSGLTLAPAAAGIVRLGDVDGRLRRVFAQGLANLTVCWGAE